MEPAKKTAEELAEELAVKLAEGLAEELAEELAKEPLVKLAILHFWIVTTDSGWQVVCRYLCASVHAAWCSTAAGTSECYRLLLAH